jgi:hypothetical protein
VAPTLRRPLASLIHQGCFEADKLLADADMKQWLWKDSRLGAYGKGLSQSARIGRSAADRILEDTLAASIAESTLLKIACLVLGGDIGGVTEHWLIVSRPVLTVERKERAAPMGARLPLAVRLLSRPAYSPGNRSRHVSEWRGGQ